MRRSEINKILMNSKAFIAEHRFMLPPFAQWTAESWPKRGQDCGEIRRNMLGWDITDFGSGDFARIGLVLFTIRNGNMNDQASVKPYAEKIMIVEEEQVTPMHFHWAKMEDIINRGGGCLVVQVYNSTSEETLSDTPVKVALDGVEKTVPAGTKLRLAPGESITVPRGLFHSFWGEKGSGTVLVGEVSQVNDDNTDNRFLVAAGRFQQIEEDVPATFLLCNEYPPCRP